MNQSIARGRARRRAVWPCVMPCWRRSTRGTCCASSRRA